MKRESFKFIVLKRTVMIGMVMNIESKTLWSKNVKGIEMALKGNVCFVSDLKFGKFDFFLSNFMIALREWKIFRQ
jgi:hypothetical protein